MRLIGGPDDHDFTGRVEEDVHRRFAEGGASVFALDGCGHDDGVGVTFDGLIDDGWPDGPRLEQLRQHLRRTLREEAVRHLLGIPQRRFAPVDLPRELGIQRHRLRYFDDIKKGDRAALLSQEVTEEIEDTGIGVGPGDWNDQLLERGLHYAPNGLTVARASRPKRRGSMEWRAVACNGIGRDPEFGRYWNC